MQAAVIVGSALLLALVAADWLVFIKKTAVSSGYGLIVGRHHEALRLDPHLFSPEGVLRLPRGCARLYADQRVIALEPDWKQFGLRFRTVWPLKGTIHYSCLEGSAPIAFVTRMPWSSAILTALWFLTVSIGILAYLFSYARAGGFSSATGAFLAVALSGVGLLILLFGLLVVVAAYRLEQKRVAALYAEFCAAARAGAES